MAKPRKKLPEKSIDVFCSKCRAKLFSYRKGGTGSLVKCFKERITRDFTLKPGFCPKCENSFARETVIRGVPALKIIGGKVTYK